MAYEFYIRVKGTKQGTFHGSSTSPHERQDRIPAYLVSHAVTQPRDQASGQASGKRVHQALTITKEVDATTPKFLQALAGNEALSSVVIAAVDAASGIVERFELSDTVVAAVRPTSQFMQGSLGQKQWQDITLTYPGNARGVPHWLRRR